MPSGLPFNVLRLSYDLCCSVAFLLPALPSGVFSDLRVVVGDSYATEGATDRHETGLNYLKQLAGLRFQRNTTAALICVQGLFKL